LVLSMNLEEANRDAEYILVSSDEAPYWKDCLDILFAPDGYEYHFRYQKKWFARGIVPQQLKGKNALIVAQLRQTASGSPLYVPLRKCHMFEVDDRGAFVVIRFTLISFASLGSEPHTYVKEFDRSLRERFGPDLLNNGLDGPFVALATGLRIQYAESGQLDADWTSMVQEIALSKRFHKTMFLGFRGLEDIKKKKAISYSNGVFKIKAGRTYRFKLAQYLPDRDGAGAVIERNKLTDFGHISLGIVGGDTKLLTPFQDVRGRYDDLVFDFVTEWSEKAAVCIGRFTAEVVDATHIPSLGFNIYVARSKQYWVGLGLFAVGIIAVALVGVFKEEETTAKVVLAVFGTLLSTFGLYLAKRVL